MLIHVKKFITLTAFAVLLAACAGKPGSAPIAPKTAPSQPEPPKFNAVKPKKDPPPFTIKAVDGWSLVNYVPLTSDAKDPMLVAIFENNLDEEVTVRAGIVAGNLPADEVDSYLDDIRAAAHSRSNAKVLKERIFRLDTLRAYEMIEGRMMPTGPQIFVSLAVADEKAKVGYIVSCGGDLEQAERIVPLCADFVEGFRIVGK